MERETFWSKIWHRQWESCQRQNNHCEKEMVELEIDQLNHLVRDKRHAILIKEDVIEEIIKDWVWSDENSVITENVNLTHKQHLIYSEATINTKAHEYQIDKESHIEFDPAKPNDLKNQILIE